MWCWSESPNEPVKMSKPWIRVLRIANTSLFWIHFRFPWRWSTWYCKASLLVSTSSTNHQHHQKKSAPQKVKSNHFAEDSMARLWPEYVLQLKFQEIVIFFSISRYGWSQYLFLGDLPCQLICGNFGMSEFHGCKAFDFTGGLDQELLINSSWS